MSLEALHELDVQRSLNLITLRSTDADGGQGFSAKAGIGT